MTDNYSEERDQNNTDEPHEPEAASAPDPWEGFKTISGLKGIQHDGQSDETPHLDQAQAGSDA